MNSKVFWRLNEAYQLGVCNQIEEETLTEEELLGLQEWVEALIEEGYNLDEYSDDELYEAYLKEAFISPYKSRPSYNNPQGHSPAMKALQKSDELQKTEPGSTRQKDQTRRAGHLAKMFKAGRDTMREELDLYDLVSEYLVSEGFCDSYEDADVIMVNMSEEWRENILDEAGRMTGANDQQASWYAQKYGNNSKPRSDSEISKEPGGKEFLARIKKAKEKSKK
jgi:hypothetical protein